MVFSQIAILSPDLLQLHTIKGLIPAFRGFLAISTPYHIVQYEDLHKRIWSTIFPYLRLLYFVDDEPLPVVVPQHRDAISVNIDVKDPNSADQGYFDECGIFHVIIDQPEGAETAYADDHLQSALYFLRKLSFEVTLLFLHSKVARPCHSAVIAKEKLGDYIVCLPWHVDPACKKNARDMVKDLGVHMKLQPPKIGPMIRAMLAKKYFGLERVIEANSLSELLQQIS